MYFMVSCYLLSMFMFGFVSNSIGYCLLLVLNALCCLSLVYLVGGFSWYALLLYIVYVGGVYILFIFVSVHLPNQINNSGLNLNLSLMAFLFFWEATNSVLMESFGGSDFSFNFCSGSEGSMYLFMCLFLLVGFFLVSFISGSKESFIR